MKDSIGEGGNTGKESELAQLSKLNNELLAHIAALNKEKLTWSSISRDDISASNAVEMPLPPAQRRLVHSFVITRAFVKVKFNTESQLSYSSHSLVQTRWHRKRTGKVWFRLQEGICARN